MSRSTFERLVGADAEPDYATIDRVFPHPVYARQLWISILNPSPASFEDLVKPLLAEAHDRLAAQRARVAQSADPGAGSGDDDWSPEAPDPADE